MKKMKNSYVALVLNYRPEFITQACFNIILSIMRPSLKLLKRTSSKPAEIWDTERVCRFLHTSLQVYQKTI